MPAVIGAEVLEASAGRPGLAEYQMPNRAFRMPEHTERSAPAGAEPALLVQLSERRADRTFAATDRSLDDLNACERMPKTQDMHTPPHAPHNDSRRLHRAASASASTPRTTSRGTSEVTNASPIPRAMMKRSVPSITFLS